MAPRFKSIKCYSFIRQNVVQNMMWVAEYVLEEIVISALY